MAIYANEYSSKFLLHPMCNPPPPPHSLFPLSHVPKVFGIIIIKIDKIKNSPSKSICIISCKKS